MNGVKVLAVMAAALGGTGVAYLVTAPLAPGDGPARPGLAAGDTTPADAAGGTPPPAPPPAGPAETVPAPPPSPAGEPPPERVGDMTRAEMEEELRKAQAELAGKPGEKGGDEFRASKPLPADLPIDLPSDI